MSATWTVADIPDQSGRTAVVTGPTMGGLGHHTALELARRGAHVVLAGRNPERTRQTVAAIRAEVPQADLSTAVVDLADLASVREAAAELSALPRLDLLVNNAGVMTPPPARTVDGFDVQLGTNHFGPFLLTLGLLPLLAASGSPEQRSRIVHVSSQLHRAARSAPLEDPTAGPARGGITEYGQSKLANLLTTFELDRRLRLADAPIDSLVAHPGFAGTHLAVGGRFGGVTGLWSKVVDKGVRAISQPAEHGAWPSLRAATDDLASGTYVGPAHLRQMRGHPVPVVPSRLARDPEVQRQFWNLSERAVGATWPLG